MSNVHPETAARFDGLERTLDSISTGLLERIGVPVGARCLEIGAGGGSIARWLADRVGPAGHVVAVDLDTRWFRHDGSSQIEVREVDLVTGPIPEGPWDLIHERLVLQHIPTDSRSLTNWLPVWRQVAGWRWRTSTPARSVQPTVTHRITS